MKNTWWVTKEDLIDEQSEVVELPIEGSYLVLGPPGSGKTNLLLLRGTYLTFAGRSNLALIVFTRPLQEFIRAGANQYNIPPERVHTLLSWELGILRDYGKSPSVPSSFEDQRKILLSELQELVATEKLKNLYQTILLDEAQDYWKEEIDIFRQLSEELFIVADSRQKIYGGTDSVPFAQSIVDKTIQLKHHFRNGLQICRLADAVAEDREGYQAMESTSNYDESTHPSTVEYQRCTDLDEEIGEALAKVDIQLKAYPGELLGLACPRKADVDRLWKAIQNSEFSKIAICQQYGKYSSFSGETSLCVSTCHGTKGLEFRALQILGAEKFNGMGRRKNLVFTAVTRAKTSLDIYYSGNLPSFLDGALASLEPVDELPKLEDLFKKEK